MDTVSEIKQLLKRSSNAFCEADPMPTWFVNEYQDVLIDPIDKIVNTTLSSGVFPLSPKAALVKPLIK